MVKYHDLIFFCTSKSAKIANPFKGAKSDNDVNTAGGKKTKRPNGEKVPNVPKVFKVSTIPKISDYL